MIVTIAEQTHAKKKCTVFAFHPWDPKEGRKHGVVMWVPHTMEELIEAVSHQLGMLDAEAKYIVLSEDGGQILEADMITDGQKLYLIHQNP